jgi:hypothetical protein
MRFALRCHFGEKRHVVRAGLDDLVFILGCALCLVSSLDGSLTERMDAGSQRWLAAKESFVVQSALVWTCVGSSETHVWSVASQAKLPLSDSTRTTFHKIDYRGTDKYRKILEALESKDSFVPQPEWHNPNGDNGKPT